MKKKLEKSIPTDCIDSIVHLYFLGYSIEEAIKEVEPENKNEVIECLKSVITE